MSIESFTGSSALYRAQHVSSQSRSQLGTTVSGNRPGPAVFTNGTILDDLLSGARPELHNLIGHHAATATAHKERGARSQRGGGDQELRDLLQKVLADGTITPQEIAQLKQAISAGSQGAGAGAGAGASAGAGGTTGTHHCSHGSQTGTGSAPVGSDDPAPPATEPTAPVTGPVPPAGGSSGAAGGDFTLGSTKVRIKGGGQAEQAKTRALFEQMYQNDVPFQQGVDSKAASGLDITITDLPDNIEGLATVGGNTMSLDPQYIGNTADYANTIAHEFAHNLGMSHGAPLEAFAAEAAAVVMV